jgi:hypothetical protein
LNFEKMAAANEAQKINAKMDAYRFKPSSLSTNRKISVPAC